MPKNSLRNAGEMFYTIKEKGDHKEIILIAVGFTPNGSTCYAWEGFSDHVLGSAGGYGYDKQSTALCEALGKIHDTAQIDGAAAGVYVVIESAASLGIKVGKCMDVFWSAVDRKVID